MCICIDSPSPSPSGLGSSTREYVRSGPEEEDHPVASHTLAQSHPESIPCTIRNLHQRVRKAHFCPVDCAVARRLEQRQDVMVCRVYYDALQKRLLQKSEPAVLTFCFSISFPPNRRGETPRGMNRIAIHTFHSSNIHEAAMVPRLSTPVSMYQTRTLERERAESSASRAQRRT